MDRRQFALSLAAGAPVPAASAQQSRKLRVGAMAVGEYTFWGIWADILSAKGKLGGGLLNMEITHCWDVNPKLAAEFAAKYDCVSVPRYDGMLGKVDAIAFGGIYETPWQHLLARPYVDARVPTYLSRPFAYRLGDLDSILELAARRGTPLMATSVQEHSSQASFLRERIKRVGTIKAVHATSWSNEYPGHFHAQWFVPKALGFDVDKVSLITDDERNATYMQETMLFRGRDGQPPFLAAIAAATEHHYLAVNVIGDKGTESVTVDRSPDVRETLYAYFAPQLFDMQRTFQGEHYQPFETIRKKTKNFLAGYYSHLERGGQLVGVDSVPADWSPRHLKPNWIDPSIFGA